MPHDDSDAGIGCALSHAPLAYVKKSSPGFTEVSRLVFTGSGGGTGAGGGGAGLHETTRTVARSVMAAIVRMGQQNMAEPFIYSPSSNKSAMTDVVLGEFEQLVLLALVRQAGDGYGISIADDISERTGRAVSIGAVYKALDRLETKGFVSSRIGDPTPERGGRRKKHFRLSATGQRALRQSLAALRSMTDGLEAHFKM